MYSFSPITDKLAVWQAVLSSPGYSSEDRCWSCHWSVWSGGVQGHARQYYKRKKGALEAKQRGTPPWFGSSGIFLEAVKANWGSKSEQKLTR